MAKNRTNPYSEHMSEGLSNVVAGESRAFWAFFIESLEELLEYGAHKQLQQALMRYVEK